MQCKIKWKNEWLTNGALSEAKLWNKKKVIWVTMKKTVGTKQCDITKYTSSPVISWKPTNQRANWGQRLALSRKSTFLCPFSHSCVNRIVELSSRHLNPLTPNDLKRRRVVRPLKIKIPSKKSRQAALRGGINSGVKGLDYNWDCAYASDFPSQLKTPTWVNWGPLLNRQ
jgi:hypothetical protein